MFNSAEYVQRLALRGMPWSGTGGCWSYWSQTVQNHSTSTAFSGAEMLEGCSTGCAGGEGTRHGQLEQRVWDSPSCGVGLGRLGWAGGG